MNKPKSAGCGGPKLAYQVTIYTSFICCDELEICLQNKHSEGQYFKKTVNLSIYTWFIEIYILIYMRKLSC